MPSVGVAISGGGHRAGLFGLGVLLYLADAGKNRDVACVSSVSGGSLTNGYVAPNGELLRHFRNGFRSGRSAAGTTSGANGDLLPPVSLHLGLSRCTGRPPRVAYRGVVGSLVHVGSGRGFFCWDSWASSRSPQLVGSSVLGHSLRHSIPRADAPPGLRNSTTRFST